jgi:polyhydroxybutyrate depolymerase
VRHARPQRLFGRIALAAAGIVLIIALCASAATAQEVPAPVESAGCGQAVQEPGKSTWHEISSGDRKREFLLHLPADYDGIRALPVVLAFHGHGRSWQGAPYAASGVDDVAFTAGLLDHLQSTLCVDTARVYATGFSNGGGFTALLACRMADRIAAVAPVAGAFYPATGENCQPVRPVPMIEFHGTADSRIPYEGGVRDLPAIPDWVAGWAERNGCKDRAADEQIGHDVTVSAWTGCAEVRHVAIAGGGHTWPGADSDNGVGATTQTIEAHEMIWNFVRGHHL